MISDSRKIIISRIVSTNGELHEEQGTMFWQDTDGTIVSSGLWADILVIKEDDLRVQAAALQLSPLEWVRRRLARVPYLNVSVYEF